eukprot:jgi/Galph1/1700/GphlegSOOS_G390.1
MKAKLLQVCWHDQQPIWSIDSSAITNRLLTTGSDRIARLWSLSIDASLSFALEWIADLKGHYATVNVGRFHPQGNIFRPSDDPTTREDFIATGSDGGVIILWEKAREPSLANFITNMEEEALERWRINGILRKHLQDVLDLCWSPCGKYLVSASVDNKVITWNILHKTAIRVIDGHHHFVQGVAMDPLGEYFTSQSSDRTLRIYQRKDGRGNFNCHKVVSKWEEAEKVSFGVPLFVDDSHCCMFRRMDWSPDGSFLVCPAANAVNDTNTCNDSAYAALVFARGYWETPAFQLTGYTRPATVVKVCPLLFEKSTTIASHHKNTSLDYRIVFAVATLDTVFIYDMDEPFPIGYVKGIHWQPITDMAWSCDGHYLLVSSTDGYISVIYFQDDELGLVRCSHHCKTSLNDMESSLMAQKEQENRNPQFSAEEDTNVSITQWVVPKRAKIR